jgi:alkylhydroperoxidase/carboxymuconolactone decarboxylase family protein YurZ
MECNNLFHSNPSDKKTNITQRILFQFHGILKPDVLRYRYIRKAHSHIGGGYMSEKNRPEWFLSIKEKHKKYIATLEELGKVAREEGPLDDKTAHLIQLAASTSIRSEGAVHSHARRALEAGAKPDEIYHAVILLTSTIGFPTVSAALSWVEDIIK